MAKRDYYDVLGVARDADETALKKAYRMVFNSDLTLTQGLARARAELPPLAEVETFLGFIEESQRGVLV